MTAQPLKSIHSTDRIALFWGQLALALFLGNSASTAQAQVQINVEFEQLASAGFLQPAHWLDAQLGQDSRSHWLAQHATIGTHYQWDNWRIGIARGQQAYALANTSALLLAAQDKTNHEVVLPTTGRHVLQAEIWTLNATTLSAAYTWRPTETASVTWEPFVQSIHDFQHMQGDLTLSAQGENSQLTGTVQQTGTRQYGFLTQDRPDQGWGSGLNLRAHWLSPWGQIGLSVNNVWSRLQFSNVHYMIQQYNLSATGSKVNIADFPSVSGEYGVTGKTSSMPAFWNSHFEPAGLPGFSFGAMGLGRQASWTAGYTGHFVDAQWWIRTVQAQNWTIGYGKSWGSGWIAALSVSADERGHAPLLSSLRVSKTW